MSGKRRFDDAGPSTSGPAKKRFQTGPESTQTPVQMKQDAVRALLERTKRAIEMKKQMSTAGGAVPTIGASPVTAPSVTSAQVGAVGNQQLDLQAMQARVAAQKAAVAARLAALRNAGTIPAMIPNQQFQPFVPRVAEDRPQQLIFKDGKVIDASGKEVKMVKRAAEFKANRDEGLVTTERKEDDTSSVQTENFDERLELKLKTRERRGFKFHSQGDFVAQASKQRAKAQLEKLQEEIARASKKTGISSAAKLAMIAPFKNDTEDLVVPDVEWWDATILVNKNYTDLDKDIPDDKKFKNISHLIQHPIPLKAPNDPEKDPELKLMLTKKERKKIRSQRRKAEEREKQEKIRLGLMDAPAPKVSKSNFMRILTNDAVADPTQIEALVKKQVDIRQRTHQEANAARALTKEQKKEKRIKKLKEDTSLEVQVAVFRVNELAGNQKFKVEMNAKQYYLSGVLIRAREQEGLNLIVVEGGPKGIKHYKKLMMKRIKWSTQNEDDSDGEDDDEEAPRKLANKCVLVWEGTAPKPAFNSFEVKNARTEGFARDYLTKHGVPQYWDMALSDQIIEEAG